MVRKSRRSKVWHRLQPVCCQTYSHRKTYSYRGW